MSKHPQNVPSLPDDWDDWFSSIILDRGYEYFEDGHVTRLLFDGTAWQACVSGAETYEVHVDPLLENINCTCPYFHDRGPCKHIAAACFEIDYQKFLTGKPAPQERKKPDVEEIVLSLSSDERTDFLLEALRKDPKLAEALIRRYGEIGQSDLKRTFLKGVYDIVDENSYRGFIDYQSSYRCERELGNYVLDFLDPLFSRGAYRDAFDLTTAFMLHLRRIAIDDSDGFFSSMIGLCHECWSLIFESADFDLKRTMYAWMASFIEDDSPADDEAGIQWFLREGTEAFLSRVFSQDARFAGVVMELADKTIADELHTRESSINATRHVYVSSPSCENSANAAMRDYVSSRTILWTEAKIQCMKTLGYDEEAVDECLAELPPSWTIIEPVANEALANEDFERCSKLVEELKARSTGRNIPAAASLLLIDAYRQTGRLDEARNELLRLVTTSTPQDRKQFESWLDDLKGLCGDSWNEHAGRILNALQSDPRKLCFYLAYSSDFESLMNAIEAQGRFALEPYEDVLARRYPDRCLSLYEQDIFRTLRECSPGRKLYWRIVEFMDHMLSFEGGRNAALRIAEELRKTYPRRPALLEELDRFEERTKQTRPTPAR